MLKRQITRIYGSVMSRHPAAYLGMMIKLLAPICKSLDFFIFRHFLNSHITTQPKIIMMVSPPRSGSTITYQVLTRIIPSVYISNLHALFPYSASTILAYGKKFGNGLKGYKNYYGYTSSLHDVNEGNEIIDKILKDKNSIEKVKKLFNKFISQMSVSPDIPIIFKNVRNYNHIGLLYKANPNIVFLYVKRDIEQVIQSELKAHYELGTFHPVPESMKNETWDDPVDFAVRQILEMRRIINSQKKEIHPNHWVEWEYETFCLNTFPMVEDLMKNVLNMAPQKIRKSNLKEPLKPSFRAKVSDEDALRIKYCLKEYAEKTSKTTQ